jgi:hypothetical protein
VHANQFPIPHTPETILKYELKKMAIVKKQLWRATVAIRQLFAAPSRPLLWLCLQRIGRAGTPRELARCCVNCTRGGSGTTGFAACWKSAKVPEVAHEDVCTLAFSVGTDSMQIQYTRLQLLV